jgi:hypothetical protein
MRVRRLSLLLLVGLLGLVGGVVAPTLQATAPAAAATPPATARADVLPAPQIDGVVWKQVIAGNTVYAGGEFTTARPFGSASGVNTVPRSNLLAYNLSTGALDTSFAPTFNGKINDMAVTPDGTKLVVVGNFTQVNGANRNRVAVFNLPAGTLSTVAPSLNASAYGVAVTNSAVYLGGIFSTVGKTAVSRTAAVSMTNGALLPFTVPVDNNAVRSIVVSPDGTQVLMGGTFTSVGGSSSPGYGLYRANATTGAALALPLNNEVRDAGSNAGILRVATDGSNFYGGGYVFNASQGNSEGMFQGSWSDGSLVNLEDCHGDTYDVAPIGDVTYIAGHQHYCGNSGGFPQTQPDWTLWHSTAWSKATQGTNTADLYGYPSHTGTPRPGLLNFFPQYQIGTYTGQSQATWTVTGNSQYVIYGGEFLKVDGIAQQGIVRFGVRAVAPNKTGPQQPAKGSFAARARSFTPGQVRVSWPALWDRDDPTLTYQVFRNGTKIYETLQTAVQWNGLGMTYTDTGQTAGSKPSYVVKAVDPDGNTVSSSAAMATVTGTNTLDPYSAQVLADGATKLWRLDDTGSTVADLSGPDYTTAGSGVGRGAAGAMLNSSDTASTFNGTSNGVAISTNLLQGPNTFTEEVWFKTTTTSGGTIAGFGDGSSGSSNEKDRILYLDSSGKLNFGVSHLGQHYTVTAPSKVNNGQWHQAVASLGSSGMTLYVDGAKVASRTDMTVGEAYGGFWRVGGDNSWSGSYFNGTIDDFAVYPTVLSAAQVLNHWHASGR